MKIHFERCHPNAKLPAKAHPWDAGFDLYATSSAILTREVGPWPLRTGLRAQIPPGFYCQIVGRSGLGIKGVVVHGGVVDSGYTGEWVVILSATGEPVQIVTGDRIGQFVVLPVPLVEVVEGTVEDGSERGRAGLGSTGN